MYTLFSGRMTHFLLGNKGAHMYNGNIFKCEECGKTYKRRSSFQKHQCCICIYCRKNFSSRQRLATHKCKTNETVTCNKCMKTYQTQASYNRHKCCYCSKCGQLYSSFQKFQLHKCKVKEDRSAHSLTASTDGAGMSASHTASILPAPSVLAV